MPEKLLTTGEAAELLRLAPYTVRTMARQGRIPSIKLPGSQQHRFKPSELAKLTQPTAEQRTV